MIRKLKVEQNSSQWHKLRARFITGTDANALKNESNWPKLLRSKINPDKVSYTNSAMLFGVEKEPLARDAYNIRHKLDMKPACFVNDDIGVMVSLDGHSDQFGYNLEIKSPVKGLQSKLATQALSRTIPASYRDQMTLGMLASGASRCDYVVYVDGVNDIEISIDRDIRQLDYFKGICKEFWAWAKT